MTGIQTIMAIILLAIAPSAVVWINLAHGYGGHENILALAVIPVFALILATIAGAAWGIYSAVWSVVRQRPLRLPLLKLGIVISLVLTFAMLHFVAHKAKRVGALARISSLGGDNFLRSLQREAQTLATKSETHGMNRFESSDLSAEFLSLGAYYATVSGSSSRYIVRAIVMPGHLQTEWIITSHEDIDFHSPGAVLVTTNVYRY